VKASAAVVRPSEHSKVEPTVAELNVKLGVFTFVGFAGLVPIVTAPAVVLTVNVDAAAVPRFPAASVALTLKV
jgi:hypothetical protein